ncbi:hypothetical protein CELL_02934 [Cellulomonas sp. T2.31MG-18]
MRAFRSTAVAVSPSARSPRAPAVRAVAVAPTIRSSTSPRAHPLGHPHRCAGWGLRTASHSGLAPPRPDSESSTATPPLSTRARSTEASRNSSDWSTAACTTAAAVGVVVFTHRPQLGRILRQRERRAAPRDLQPATGNRQPATGQRITANSGYRLQCSLLHPVGRTAPSRHARHRAMRAHGAGRGRTASLGVGTVAAGTLWNHPAGGAVSVDEGARRPAHPGARAARLPGRATERLTPEDGGGRTASVVVLVPRRCNSSSVRRS